MNRLFRTPTPGLNDYTGLALFAAVYLLAMALILAPDSFALGHTAHSIAITPR